MCVRICFRARVSGLAAEAGFFALLSLPALVLGLAGAAGWVGSTLGAATRSELLDGIAAAASRFLTVDAVDNVILPTFEQAIARPRFDLISAGFVLSVWSGSRAMNVYIDTISIMYGFGGHRGIVKTRALALLVYGLTLVLGAIILPLLVIGPSLIEQVLPSRLAWVLSLYWPVVSLLGMVLLASLYHVATPVRARWRRDLPGALTAFGLWVIASEIMRRVIAASIGGVSIYGPLAAPIVVTVWLYLIALAVLIGAAVNAAIDHVWPDGGRSRPRQPEAQIIELRDAEQPVGDEEPKRPRSATASD